MRNLMLENMRQRSREVAETHLNINRHQWPKDLEKVCKHWLILQLLIHSHQSASNINAWMINLVNRAISTASRSLKTSLVINHLTVLTAGTMNVSMYLLAKIINVHTILTKAGQTRIVLLVKARKEY